MITSGVPDSHACRSLVQAIRSLYDSVWWVEFCLIYREANMCADSLAKASCGLSRGITFFDKLPVCHHLALFVDSVGHGCPGLVKC